MAQDPSEPPANRSGCLDRAIQRRYGTILRHRYERSWLAASPPASNPTTSFKTYSFGSSNIWIRLRSTERPEAWLFQIARNALRDALRSRQRKDGRTDPLDVDVPAQAGHGRRARLRGRARAVSDSDDRTLGGALPDGDRTDISPRIDAGGSRTSGWHFVVGNEVPSPARARTAATDARAVLRDRCRRPRRRIRLSSPIGRRLWW